MSVEVITPVFASSVLLHPSQTRATRGLMRVFVPPPPALIPQVFSCRCDIPCRYTNSLAAMRDTARCPRFSTEVGRSLLLYSPSWWHENSDAFFNRRVDVQPSWSPSKFTRGLFLLEVGPWIPSPSHPPPQEGGGSNSNLQKRQPSLIPT